MTNWYITNDYIIKSSPRIKEVADNISSDYYNTYALAVQSLKTHLKNKEK